MNQADRPEFVMISSAVRNRRKALGVTQVLVAQLAGCDPSFVGDVENGKSTVRLDKLVDILDVLGLRIEVK